MILRPKYGSAGMLALPYFVFVEAIAPILEVIGLAGLVIALFAGGLSASALVPVGLIYLAGIAASYLVLALDDLTFGTFRSTGDRMLMVGHVLFEQVVFRPLTLVWRLWGLVLFLQGRSEWGVQERRGLGGGLAG